MNKSLNQNAMDEIVSFVSSEAVCSLFQMKYAIFYIWLNYPLKWFNSEFLKLPIYFPSRVDNFPNVRGCRHTCCAVEDWTRRPRSLLSQSQFLSVLGHINTTALHCQAHQISGHSRTIGSFEVWSRLTSWSAHLHGVFVKYKLQVLGMLLYTLRE